MPASQPSAGMLTAWWRLSPGPPCIASKPLPAVAATGSHEVLTDAAHVACKQAVATAEAPKAATEAKKASEYDFVTLTTWLLRVRVLPMRSSLVCAQTSAAIWD